ncbi:MAG: hypothetical protein HZB18_15015 [Chloroflexi bacterium]|nr:hypothetical protein [Chloroflexota bacterium]
MKKIILLALALVLSACSAGAGTEFDGNLSRWEDANIPHYRYTLFISCFCVFSDEMPLTIEVKNGEVVSMTRSDGTAIAPTDNFTEIYQPYLTMNRLFLKLEADLTGEADNVTVTYDPVYGFPSNVSIDYIIEAIDDEISYQVSNFEVLE